MWNTPTGQSFPTFEAGMSAARGGFLVAGTVGYSWQLPLPNGWRLLIRQEAHGLGNSCPCPDCPPADQEVWHYNIELQASASPGGKNRSVFNLHAAVWRGADRACVAIYNVRRNRRNCVFSDCFDPDDEQRVKDAIRQLALDIQSQLEAAAGLAGQVLQFAGYVIEAIASFIIGILLLPFRQPGFA